MGLLSFDNKGISKNRARGPLVSFFVCSGWLRKGKVGFSFVEKANG